MNGLDRAVIRSRGLLLVSFSPFLAGLMIGVEVGDARVGERVASVAASLEARIVELASDIRDLIQRDIPTLDGDPALTSLLDASVEENVSTVVHMLRHGIITANVEAPTAALGVRATAGAARHPRYGAYPRLPRRSGPFSPALYR
jgi:hypothetical protein